MPRTTQTKLASNRASYAERQLRQLRAICPELPDDILERTSLRSLTYAVHRASRCAGPYQTALDAAPREEEGRPISLPMAANVTAEEARSNA